MSHPQPFNVIGDFETLEIDSRYGRMVVPEPERDIIARFLVEQGEWAELEVQFISRLIPNGARIADIGAFVGTFGLGMQICKELAHVCFVEANPHIVPLLQNNAERNCHIEHTVVSALVAPANFRPVGSRDAQNLGSACFLTEMTGPGRLPVASPNQIFTLEELDRKHGPFDLFKLDVEGMEHEILSSATPIVGRAQTTFWLECNEHERSLRLADFILSQGRSLYYFAHPSFNPDNFRASQQPIFPFAYESGLLVCSIEPQLSPELIDKGCFLRRIDRPQDLTCALERTPRWAPREWWNLPREQLVALSVRQIGQRDAALAEHRAALASTEAVVATLHSVISERDKAICEYQAELARTETIVGDLRSGVATHESTMRESRAALADAQSRLAERLSYMVAREGQLRAAEQALWRLELLAAERLAELQMVKLQKGDIERTAAHRLALLRVERDLRTATEEEREKAEARTRAIVASTSWRMTLPLRAALSKMPRLGSTWRNLRRR